MRALPVKPKFDIFYNNYLGKDILRFCMWRCMCLTLKACAEIPSFNRFPLSDIPNHSMGLAESAENTKDLAVANRYSGFDEEKLPRLLLRYKNSRAIWNKNTIF